MIDLASPEQAVQAIMVPALLLLGLSHIVRPALWRDFFNHLHSLGTTGVVTRTFAFELWPALLIMVFHQVWSGPGIALTIYGWLLMTKVTLSLLVPELGLKSLAMADAVTDARWAVAGLLLIALSASSLWSLLSAL
ncbi:MAG: hypothetical protein AAF559_08955 [Pseudomonadota bacterium]